VTPEQIFTALGEAKRFPRDAMIAAGEHREEMIPVFLDLTHRLRRATPDSVAEDDLSAFLFAFFLLGEWRDPRAYRPLIALLRHDPEFLELLLGDALTEGTARVTAGVCDGDLQPIFETIEDPAADEFVRCQMIDALVLIARNRPETQPEVADYLEQFFAADMEKPETLWGSWAFAIANLGLERLEPQVQQAFAQEWISPDEADFDFFQQQLREAVAEAGSSWYQSSRNGRLIESAIDDLSGWYCFSEKFIEDQASGKGAEAHEDSWYDFFGETFERDAPKVGRNDPCPCGSGKKFKKCCLQ
jgi:hypothetical protein